MIAQTMAEYGTLQSIGTAVTNAWHRIDLYVGSGNLKYYLLLALVIIVGLIATRRRSH